jgi:hypothetical protein
MAAMTANSMTNAVVDSEKARGLVEGMTPQAEAEASLTQPQPQPCEWDVLFVDLSL